MSLTLVGSFPVGGVNLAAAGAVAVMAPLIGQFDATLFGALGLGGLQADLNIQLNAALQAQLQISASISNPLLNIQAALSGIANLQASLTAALGLGIPSIQLSAALSASAAVSATLAAKLGGLQALISVALAVKLPAADFLAALAANLSAGPLVVASWGFATSPTTLAQTGVDIQNAFSAGLGGLSPSDTVYGVLITTKQPSASLALAATIKVT